jgi:pantothenate kinase type III
LSISKVTTFDGLEKGNMGSSRRSYDCRASTGSVQAPVRDRKPENIIGKTESQSGLIHGYAGLVDGVVVKIKSEMKTEPRVIATGGVASLIAPETRTIEEVTVSGPAEAHP